MRSLRPSARASFHDSPSSGDRSVRRLLSRLGVTLVALVSLASGFGVQPVSAGLNDDRGFISVQLNSCRSRAFPAVRGTFDSPSCVGGIANTIQIRATYVLTDQAGNNVFPPDETLEGTFGFTFGNILFGNYTVNISTNGQVIRQAVNLDRSTVNLRFTAYLPVVNNLPVVTGGSPIVIRTPEDTAVPISIAATDDDGDELTYTPAGAPAHGKIRGIAPDLTYTPDQDYVGPDSFRYTIRDMFGGTTTAQVDVTVAEVNDRPTIADGADLTVPAIGPDGATVSFDPPAATDVEDGTLTAVCAPVSNSLFAVGRTTVTCTATDGDGATATSDFTVTVTDTTPPVLAVPTSFDVEATSASGATVSYTATATDLIDGTLPVTCTPASGATFPLGPTTVTCSASDAAGNDAERTFTVTVTDTTPPALTVPAAISAEATSAAGAGVPFTVTATDLVDGSVVPICRVGDRTVTSPDAFPIGTTTVTCTATDAAGNTSTAQSFTVTVRDTTGPAITWVGGPQPSQTYTRANLPAAPTCTATDAASIVTQCRVYGYSTAVGTHTLTARARDTEGNSSVSTRTYIVTTSGATAPTATSHPVTPRPTATPTQPPVPTAAPTRAPRPTSPPTVEPTQGIPTAAPTTAPTRPPRR